MAKEIVLASHNKKKTVELRAILAPLGYTLRNLTDFPGAPEPEETGDTFADNAVIKAESAMRFTGLPALADDSGLVVDALAGEPGVRSARYAGEDAGDDENNALLLQKMAAVPEADRTARFACCIALAVPGGETRTWYGESEGVILFTPRGECGFGYDPLFYSPVLGETFAEAVAETKNRVSHRGKALAAFVAGLGNLALSLLGIMAIGVHFA